MDEIRIIVNEAIANATPFDYLLGIFVGIIWLCLTIVVPQLIETFFYWFMRRVFKVKRGKYVKGWFPIEE